MKHLAFILLLLPALVLGKRNHTERWYQERTCSPEQIEHRLDDGKRVDCLTETHAIEHDFADKVYECVGQALYYSSQTGRQPGCMLIIENLDKDCKYLKVAQEINRAFDVNIAVWMIGAGELCED